MVVHLDPVRDSVEKWGKHIDKARSYESLNPEVTKEEEKARRKLEEINARVWANKPWRDMK
jgi:hypothetical protein